MADQQRNIVYYLKYRPQSLDDLIGQDHIKKTIIGAFAQNKLSHAYLFVGPRGTGKTSTARILAKMVNCESSVIPAKAGIQKQESDGSPIRSGMTMNIPCNKCSICLSITDGSNLDLIEIDAASNRGIEDIRTLRENIKLSPSSSRKKVYIIDEVHMLTPEAFNALLKTLEEPPNHALFILATTEVQKLPQTIISRVQRLDFKLASSAELVEALKRIVAKEKIDIEDEALKYLVKQADGSFRDGVKLLDQIATIEGKINLAALSAILTSSKFEDQLDLLQKLADKNISEVLININKQVEQGSDIKELILSLQDLTRSLMLIKNEVGEKLVKINWTEDKYEQIVKLSQKFNNNDLIKVLENLQQAFEKLKFSSIPVLALEIAVVEICSPVYQSVSESVNQQIKESVEQKKVDVVQTTITESPTHRSTEIPISSDSPNDDIQKLKEKWTLVLETIRPFNFSLEALLRSTNITQCTEATIIMEVPYSFHQRILEAPKNRDLLESILSDILGRSIQVSTVLGNRPQRREDVANIEVAADDEIIRVAAEIFNSDSIN